MKALVLSLVTGTVLGLSLLAPAPAAADDYWDNHWNWYDSTYRPYYYRGGYNSYYGPGYYNNYGYGGYNPGYYNNYGYGNYGYGGYGNWGTPYRNYYGTGNFGYGRTFGGGSAVNIGGMTFGWR